jgi:hypothetical protein
MKKEQRAKKRRGAIIIFAVTKIGGVDVIVCTKKDKETNDRHAFDPLAVTTYESDVALFFLFLCAGSQLETGTAGSRRT